MAMHRKFYRIALSDQIELAFQDRSFQGFLENLSMNGALVNIEGEVDMPAGQSCLLDIHLVEDGVPLPPLKLGAETVHSYDTLVGVRFLEYDEATKDRLLLLIKRKLSEPKKINDGLDRIRGYLAEYSGVP
jgi:hypothetical protein